LTAARAFTVVAAKETTKQAINNITIIFLNLIFSLLLSLLGFVQVKQKNYTEQTFWSNY
jgi:hypothetical protein